MNDILISEENKICCQSINPNITDVSTTIESAITDASTTNAIGWEYDFSREIRLGYCVDLESTNPNYVNNFVKSIRMSPNGCAMLYSSEDGYIHYIDLRDVAFWDNIIDTNTKTVDEHPPTLQSCYSFSHTEVVYDFDWLPNTSVERFASCCKDTPIRLWDLADGSVSLYKTYDHVDELMTATSVRISRDCQRLYGGYNGSLRSFSLERPGREEYIVRSNEICTGSLGLVSSVCEDCNGCIAIGSYGGYAALLDSRLIGGDACCMWSMLVQPRGIHNVTLLQSCPLMLICERNTGIVRCYDRRNMSTEVWNIKRHSGTQQRLEISMSADERWCASGDVNGDISVYDVTDGSVVYKQTVYADSIPCACFHPYNPILVCGTGQRHFGEEALPSCCLVYQLPWKYVQ